MNIELDRDHILGGLAEIWTEWSDWAGGLTEADWATLSRAPPARWPGHHRRLALRSNLA